MTHRRHHVAGIVSAVEHFVRNCRLRGIAETPLLWSRVQVSR